VVQNLNIVSPKNRRPVNTPSDPEIGATIRIRLKCIFLLPMRRAIPVSGVSELQQISGYFDLYDQTKQACIHWQIELENGLEE
jgi:hypothetical protein